MNPAAFWDSGWFRAHVKHIGPDRKINHGKFMKIVRRETKAVKRVAKQEGIR
jgi:hypothetical protein